MITPDLTAYAGNLHMEFDEEQPAGEIRRIAEHLISRITVSCFERGAKLIGHVKGVVTVGNGGFLAVSSTTEDGRTQSKGDLNASRVVDMVVNVIIYGLDVHRVEDIVRQVADEVIGPAYLLETDEHHHDHDDDDHDHGKVIDIH